MSRVSFPILCLLLFHRLVALAATTSSSCSTTKTITSVITSNPPAATKTVTKTTSYVSPFSEIIMTTVATAPTTLTVTTVLPSSCTVTNCYGCDPATPSACYPACSALLYGYAPSKRDIAARTVQAEAATKTCTTTVTNTVTGVKKGTVSQVPATAFDKAGT